MKIFYHLTKINFLASSLNAVHGTVTMTMAAVVVAAAAERFNERFTMRFYVFQTQNRQ